MNLLRSTDISAVGSVGQCAYPNPSEYMKERERARGRVGVGDWGSFIPWFILERPGRAGSQPEVASALSALLHCKSTFITVCRALWRVRVFGFNILVNQKIDTNA